MSGTETRESTENGLPLPAVDEASEDNLSELRLWILRRIEEHIELDDPSEQTAPWSSKYHIRQDIQHGEWGRDEVVDEVMDMVDDGMLIYWVGYVAPVRNDVLRAIVTAEGESDVTRKRLVIKCNEMLGEL